jgi:hypothetical protein
LRVAKPKGSARFGTFLSFLVTLGLLLIVAPATWQVAAGPVASRSSR